MTLRRLQKGIEKLYRLDAAPDVRRFLIEDDAPVRQRESRQSREQLFVGGTSDEIRLGIFVDDEVLANLKRNNPAREVNDANLGDFLLAIEAVSHFLLVIHCARAQRPIRPVELELQAEVDKYLVCLLLLHEQGSLVEGLASRLAGSLSLEEDLSSDEQDRYQVAGALSASYSIALEELYVRTRRLVDLLAEVRRFYRLGLDGKFGRITALAA